MSFNIFTARSGRPAVLAHRGSGPGIGPGGHAENTLGAMLWAVDNGADWLECDVQLSADGDLVLRHDVSLDARDVRAMRTRELALLGVPTLAEVHETVPPSIGFDLDIKISMLDIPAAGQDLFTAVEAWARSAHPARPVLLLSFCPSIFRLATDVPLGWATNHSAWYYESVVSAVRLDAAVAAVHADDVVNVPPQCPSAEKVGAFARLHGVAVKAWGVVPADVPALIDGGVTGLCGDDVPGIAAAVDAYMREGRFPFAA